MISLCLEKGWNSVLFDGSKLIGRREQAPVHRGRRRGRALRRAGGGRDRGLQARRGRCRRRGARGSRPSRPRSTSSRSTGVDVFAPAIGNAHGMYRSTPKLDSQRVTDIVEATGIPVALHGGTGMTPEQFSDLVGRGCAKVNISTALKIALHAVRLRPHGRQPGQVRSTVTVRGAARRGHRDGQRAHPPPRQRGQGADAGPRVRLRRRPGRYGA